MFVTDDIGNNRTIDGDVSGKNASNSIALTNCGEVKLQTCDFPDESTRDEEVRRTKSASCTFPDDPANTIPKERLERQQRIAKGPFQPVQKSFPRTSSRSFQAKWYSEFPFLEYSIKEDKVFCFHCRFFATENATSKGHSNVTFVSEGFKNWKKGTEKFRAHQLSTCHQSSLNAYKAFCKNSPIDVHLNEQKQTELSAREENRRRNRDFMERLVEIVRLLAKGGRPFRGHNEKHESNEKGLFLEIFNLLLKFDPFLKKYLETAPRNATYMSNRIQNDLIASLHNVMLKSIAAEIGGNKVSIMADETSDCGHHEQLAVVVRYFCDKKNRPVERFLTLKRLLSMDARTIFDTLSEVIHQMNIDWESIIAVCFDGASAMSGAVSGVQALFKQKNKNIHYVHCYAHCLNLVLVDACTSHDLNSIIFDFFGIIQYTYSFIESSPTRHAIFERILKEAGQKLLSLKSLSVTRWACHADAVAAIKSSLKYLIEAIEEIASSTKVAEVRAKANGLLSQMKTFQFMTCLEMLPHILSPIAIVSRSLQSSQIDLLSAMDNVKHLQATLQNLREDDAWFKCILANATENCNYFDIEIPPVKRRKVSRRLDDTWQNQVQFNSKEEEFKVQTLYPFLDSLIGGINERFSQETVKLVNAVGRLLVLKPNPDDLRIISSQFCVSEIELQAEVRLLNSSSGKSRLPWEWLRWMSDSDTKATVTYTNFCKVLKMFCVIPVTSCSCERVFSKMTHVKTKLRSTTSDMRLNHLMLPYVEQNLATQVSASDIVEVFKIQVPTERRLTL